MSEVNDVTLTALLHKAQSLMRNEFLKCQNNDCKCREGVGLCNQCRESAIELCNRIDEVTE